MKARAGSPPRYSHYHHFHDYITTTMALFRRHHCSCHGHITTTTSPSLPLSLPATSPYPVDTMEQSKSTAKAIMGTAVRGKAYGDDGNGNESYVDRQRRRYDRCCFHLHTSNQASQVMSKLFIVCKQLHGRTPNSCTIYILNFIYLIYIITQCLNY